MRGSGLDTESRSPTPQDREDTKDEVYWWLHFHKLQEYHSYFRGKLISVFESNQNLGPTRISIKMIIL